MFDVFKIRGFVYMYCVVMKKLDVYFFLGYSFVGEVIEVGLCIEDIFLGNQKVR